MQKGDARTIRAWTMYDWANSVYSLTITSAVFPMFYVALTADFGAGTVDGTMTGMRGVSGTSLSNTKFFDVAGDIAIGANSSGIGEALDGGPAGASAWHADFAGRLDTDVRGEFVVRGDLAGDFVGSGSLAGMQGSDRNAIVTRNSSQGSMSLDISATR